MIFLTSRGGIWTCSLKKIVRVLLCIFLSQPRGIPSRELIYPTMENGKSIQSSSKVPWDMLYVCYMLEPWRVPHLIPRQYPRKHVEPPATSWIIQTEPSSPRRKGWQWGLRAQSWGCGKRRSAFLSGFGGWVMVQVLMVRTSPSFVANKQAYHK